MANPNNSNHLAEYDDTNLAALPGYDYGNDDSGEIISLCRIFTDKFENRWLSRCADLNTYGNYEIFYQDKNEPPYFRNRSKLYYNFFENSNTTSDAGFYGIWTWSATRRDTDETKDFLVVNYTPEIDAIEVKIMEDSFSLDELIRLLKKGVDFNLNSGKVMFAIKSGSQYTGILCKAKDLDINNGVAVFSKNYTIAPVYRFGGNDILNLHNGFLFYRKPFAGIPIDLYPVRGPREIVKDIIFDFLSWNACKARGLTHDQHKSLKNFIGTIPDSDVTEKIVSELHCSPTEAQNYLDEFLDNAVSYIDGSSIEDDVLGSVISANDKLWEKGKNSIREELVKENEDLIAEYNSLNDDLGTIKNEIKASKSTLEKTKADNEQFEQSLANRKKLAEDVEKAVAEKIQNARENAAEFLATMAFTTALPEKTEKAVETAKVPALYHTLPARGDINDLEVYHSWTHVIDTTAFELELAGVSGKYSSGLASFLCAAYSKKQPILLVGPNTNDIIQAFCASVTHLDHIHGILYCEGKFNHQVIAEIGTHNEDIVIIHNLLGSRWMNGLPEILSKKDIFYIVEHPYAEDIQIEPRSLYNFILPVFTEFLVDKKAEGGYRGGYFTEVLDPNKAPEDNHVRLKSLPKLGLPALVKNQITSLAASMHGIYPEVSGDDDFLLALLPIAYATMKMDKLTESLDSSDIALSKDLKSRMEYVLGDIQ